VRRIILYSREKINQYFLSKDTAKVMYYLHSNTSLLQSEKYSNIVLEIVMNIIGQDFS